MGRCDSRRVSRLEGYAAGDRWVAFNEDGIFRRYKAPDTGFEIRQACCRELIFTSPRLRLSCSHILPGGCAADSVGWPMIRGRVADGLD